VQVDWRSNCIPIVSVLSAVTGAVSVLGTGSGLSSSADIAETGSDTVRLSLEIGVGPTGETGALSLLSSADLWYCASTAFAMLELPASCAAPAPTPVPAASGTATCLSECWPVARGWVGGSFGGTSGLLSCWCCSSCFCCCFEGWDCWFCWSCCFLGFSMPLRTCLSLLNALGAVCDRRLADATGNWSGGVLTYAHPA
jgi:hypothetical protein